MLRIVPDALLIIVCSILFSCSDSPSENTSSDKRQELTSKEKRLVQSIGDKLEFKFFITGDIPGELKNLETALKELMEEIHRNNANITFTFIDPYTLKEPDRSEYMEDLYVNKRISFSQVFNDSNGKKELKYVFTDGLINYHGIEYSFELMNVSDQLHETEMKKVVDKAVANLKRNILKQIKRILAGKAPRIAFLTGHGEADHSQTFIIEKAMSEFYRVERINLKNEEGQVDINALDTFDGLIVCKPVIPFDEREKFVIDKFIMNGGKVIWMIDQLYVNEDTLDKTGQTFGLDNDIGITDMLQAYGIRLNKELIVSEKAAPLGIEASERKIISWYFFPLIKTTDKFEPVSGIPDVKLEYAGTLEFIGEKKKIKCIPLLRTEKGSITLQSPVRISLSMVQNQSNFKKGNAGGKLIACLLEGKFESCFKNLLSGNLLAGSGQGIVTESPDTRMMIIADGDLIINDTATMYNSKTRKTELGYLKLDTDKYQLKNADGTEKFRYGNLDFFMNVLDEMMLGYNAKE